MPDADKDKETLSEAVCKRVLLSFSMHFFSIYEATSDVQKVLEEFWNEADSVQFDKIDINKNLIEFSGPHGQFWKINGRLTDGMIECLVQKDIGYRVKNQDGVQIICLEKKSDTNNSIKKIYEDTSIMFQCVSPVFYSGALARVKEIKEKKSYGNQNILNYQFELESISYATHLGFKDPRMGNVSEFFSDTEKELLKKFDEEEAKLQKELYDRLKEKDDIINALNDYLSKSGYTHGMNTSSNIVTKDGYLVYTKRGKSTFDSGTLYCSANGVCEIFDQDVAFYHNTVACDFPTIAEFHEFGSFGGELTRESYAELGVFVEPTTWDYYGFTVMGYHSESSHRFPLHFNILAHARTEKTINEIRKDAVTAVEKEENENVLGMKVMMSNGVFERVRIGVFGVLRWLYAHKDFVTEGLVVATYLSLVLNWDSAETNFFKWLCSTICAFSITDCIHLLLAVLTLLFMFKEICSIFSELFKRHKKTYHKYVGEVELHEKNLENLIKKAQKNARCGGSNPIYILMLQLYYYQQVKEK